MRLYQTTWRHVLREYRQDILTYTAICALAVALGIYTIPANADPQRGPATDSDYEAGRNANANGGDGSDFRFDSNQHKKMYEGCSSCHSGGVKAGPTHNDNGSGSGKNAHNDQDAPGKN